MSDLKFLGICSFLATIPIVSGLMIRDIVIQNIVRRKQKDKDTNPE